MNKAETLFEKLVVQKYGRVGSTLVTGGAVLVTPYFVYAKTMSGDQAVGVYIYLGAGIIGLLIGGLIIRDVLSR